MDWAVALKEQIRERATAWAELTNAVAYKSSGSPGTIMFPAGIDGPGNLFPEVSAAVGANPEWRSRLNKAHPQRRHLPEEFRAHAKELDSSNSSDALLMNCFCYPGASERFAAVLGATPREARPRFGIAGEVELGNGVPDRTELDMMLGDTIIEAKLTEKDFTARPKDHVRRYARLSSVFDLETLPGDADSFEGFQLIRNVLAAAQQSMRLIVLIDARRPDLLQEWWGVHAAIADGGLRSRCQVRFWQELAKAAKPQHRALLEARYGL